MSENNENGNEVNSEGGENSTSHEDSRHSSVFGANPLLRSGVLRPSVLAPSVLESAKTNAVTVELDANVNTKVDTETVNNPFKNKQIVDEELNKDNGFNAAQNAEGPSNKTEKDNAEDDEVDDRPDPLTLLRKNGIERANLFAAAKNSIPRVEKSGFVFGQNVHERVVADNINNEAKKSTASEAEPGTSSELLFSSVVQNAAKANDNNDNNSAPKETDIKSLTDVARAYEESRAQKRKYEEVETFTGEENEVNIIDISCKLFAFINSNWEERGRGSLRLNDSKNEQECSRVVFRTSGNLRLVLNTKVWAGMIAERSSQKSLRLTAIDNSGKIKIFLLMARPAEIAQLHKALEERIEKRKLSNPGECSTTSDNNCSEDVKNGRGVPASVQSDSEQDEEMNAPPLTAAADAATARDEDDDDSAEPNQKKAVTAAANENS